MSIALVDVALMLMLVVLTLMHLFDVITCLVMRVLWMVAILLYINIKDAVDGTDGTQNRQTSIERGKEIHLCIVHKIRYSAFCKVAYYVY